MPTKKQALSETFDNKTEQESSNLLDEGNILPEE
jgi:hypothetical protein